MLTKYRKITPRRNGGQVHIGSGLLEVSGIKGNRVKLVALPPTYDDNGNVITKGKIIIEERGE